MTVESRNSDPEKTSTSKQRHGKHVSAVANNHATIEELLEAAISVWSVPRIYKEFSVSRECEGVAFVG
jgi:hypothetical protein